MSNYRVADCKTQWFQDDYPGADLHLNKDTMVVTLHTTEGTDWPSYEGGATAPNYTGLPPLGEARGKWRGHFPDEKSSRALRNAAGGVNTNTLNTVQIELIGTCDPRNAKRWGGTSNTRVAGRDYVFWPDADKRQLHWVGRILADFHKRHGFRLRTGVVFKPYPASYGVNNGVRLPFAGWSNYVGVLGHQHVPENSHGDPGNIDIQEILGFARKLIQK